MNMMELSDRQQSLIRVTLRADLREWERLAKEHKPWPFAEGRVKEAQEIIKLLYQGDIHVTVPEHACDRCGYTQCVCGDPEFEQMNLIELNRASEVE